MLTGAYVEIQPKLNSNGVIDIESISGNILTITSTDPLFLGRLYPLPPFAASSVQDSIASLTISITIDSGYNGSRGTFSAMAIIWSNKEFPY